LIVVGVVGVTVGVDDRPRRRRRAGADLGRDLSGEEAIESLTSFLHAGIAGGGR
jgi:hypothetical protein